MKKLLAALLAGIVLGSTGIAAATATDVWQRNNVSCSSVGKGADRGVICTLRGSKKSVVITQRQIMVGSGNKLTYLTTSR
jgi:hypothetical protein